MPKAAVSARNCQATLTVALQVALDGDGVTTAFAAASLIDLRAISSAHCVRRRC
jgi:hypothetical protein